MRMTERREFKLSVSSIKTFYASKAKWAWKYILGIQDSEDNQDSLLLWKMFENRLFTWEDNWDIMWEIVIANKEKFATDYDTLKHNSKWMPFVKGKTQVKVEWELFGLPIIWYIDNLLADCIEDIKTCHYLSKQENIAKNPWSWMSYNEEYELQLWIYMKLTWLTKAKILEVSKFNYKDKHHAHQIIEYEFTKEFDERMTVKFTPIVNEMKELFDKYSLKLAI